MHFGCSLTICKNYFSNANVFTSECRGPKKLLLPTEDEIVKHGSEPASFSTLSEFATELWFLKSFPPVYYPRHYGFCKIPLLVVTPVTHHSCQHNSVLFCSVWELWLALRHKSAAIISSWKPHNVRGWFLDQFWLHTVVTICSTSDWHFTKTNRSCTDSG